MYIGRFAPSPTGPLHFGSLVAALASYLDAKAHNGKWLIRIEDLDTPRCVDHAADLIIDTLRHHGMQSDAPVLYQSSRLTAYHQAIKAMQTGNHAYFCQCTRKTIRAQGGVHNNQCRYAQHSSGAIRFMYNDVITSFNDRWQHKVNIDDAHALEDFIVQRRDGIIAYNLAVVLDDIYQQVTHVVRGEDLLTTTSAHLGLYRYFAQPVPTYLHIPVIKDGNGNKLSKQNHAPAIDDNLAAQNLVRACEALQLEISGLSAQKNIDKILSFATDAWHQRWGSSKLAHLV